VILALGETSGRSLVEGVQGALAHSSFPCFPANSGWFKTHISKRVTIMIRKPTVMRVSARQHGLRRYGRDVVLMSQGDNRSSITPPNEIQVVTTFSLLPALVR